MTPEPWPELSLAEWQDTRDTFHLWTQAVGKVRPAHASHVNHWWNTPLYVTATGLTTSLIPCANGQGFQFGFDLQQHRLGITVTSGATTTMALSPRTVADCYAELMTRLDALGLAA